MEISRWLIESIIMIMFNPLSSKKIRKVILQINGFKSFRSSESIKKNHSLVDIRILIIMFSIGMPLPRLIRKKLIINCVLPDKHKHTNGLPNLPR